MYVSICIPPRQASKCKNTKEYMFQKPNIVGQNLRPNLQAKSGETQGVGYHALHVILCMCNLVVCVIHGVYSYSSTSYC